MKKFLTIFCVVATFIALFVLCDNNDDYAHFGSINGTVTSRANNAAVVGANVTLSPGGTVAQTDAGGFYKFENLEPGDYSVNVQHIAHKTDNTIITVRVGESVTVNFSLIERED